MANTQIRVDGAAKVTVTNIETIPDLFIVGSRLSRLAGANTAGVLLNLSARVGELALIGGLEDASYEDRQTAVANVLVSTVVAATVLGVSEPGLIEAVRNSVELQAGDFVKAKMIGLLEDAGLTQTAVADDSNEQPLAA